ncbi:MAG: thioredoxin [Gammaproteobacteria bacterium]|nr:thioredoxin [Gammaproteobacteria bacterium]MCW8839642.1 thioredoxin [Gammaproteobacteria bacterium]MCW8928049.1 thioredoxin [Gammaproteobacteria bacterium]MCW8958016.1 thioredoxin [Gammaproteobacteria bacterium]MCW8973475.1 thioredoxin [Gammaproteobacteria bacterium]
MATVELTKDNFDEVAGKNDFVIVDFWAPWCGPCQSFGPVYEEISEKHDDIVFAKVNTQDEQDLAGHFQIRSIPTLMILRDQIVIYAQPGALMGGQFEELIEKARELDMDEVRKQVAEQQAGQQEG